MSSALTVSVVIVSRERPAALRRCLTALAQQFFHPFEVVVVTDRAGREAVASLPSASKARLVAFDEANISEARNLGIGASAGEIVAFIDDDAVPEPTWLQFLVAPFARAEVDAAGGFVRGRNGISWQSRGAWVDGSGAPHPLDLPEHGASLLRGRPGRGLKTEGTNMALRRDWLVRNGGFDPRFRYFLDETDLNMRLAAAGAVTALVPMAQVHHGFAESAHRRADRVPRNLFEIGASWAVFLSKHCPDTRRKAAWREILGNERRRLLRHMIGGALEPRDVGRLMSGLEAGYLAGQDRVEKGASMPPLPRSTEPFTAYTNTPPVASVAFAGRWWSCRSLTRDAAAAVASGRVATVLCMSHTALFHKVRFVSGGWWEQSGGLFGRSERLQPLFRLTTLSRRKSLEIDRTREARGL
ncbi:MAG TPA: glycosyl transferase [Rhodobacteraceae bacterium]|nr:glycosyl transferase [Paracoccaceae bacterium]